jgi:hypothetical protein
MKTNRTRSTVGFGFAMLVVAGMAACGTRPLSKPDGAGAAGGTGAAGAAGVAGDSSGPPPFAPYSPPSGAVGGAGGGPDDTGAGAGTAGDAPSTDVGGQGGSADFQPPAPAPPPPPLPPPPPPVSPAYCDGMPGKPLPYAIASDFTTIFALNAANGLTLLAVPDCGQTFFPDVRVAGPAEPDAGVDAKAATADAGTREAGAPPLAVPTPSECFAFKYRPDDCNFAAGAVDAVGIQCWAGVIFTSSPLTGTPGQGICIAPGATAVHFKARASRRGARVKFGSIREGLDTTEFYLSLTTSWADYSVSIPAAEPYDNEPSIPLGGVWNGFSVVVDPQDHIGGTYVFVSDVIWAAM